MHWRSTHLMVTTPPSPKPKAAKRCQCWLLLKQLSGVLFGICWIWPCLYLPNCRVISVYLHCCYSVSFYLLLLVPDPKWTASAQGWIVRGCNSLCGCCCSGAVLVKGVPFLMCTKLMKWVCWFGRDLGAEEIQCCFLTLSQFVLENGEMYEKHKTIPQGVFIPVTYSNKHGANDKWRKREETTVLLLMFPYPSWELCFSCSLVWVDCKVKSQYAVEHPSLHFLLKSKRRLQGHFYEERVLK